MESFHELALPAFLHESLQKMNFEKPTPVQAAAIPPGLEGRDIVASAETGSGKTAAFGIPLLTFLDKNRSQTALVLTPTRELAEQVQGVLDQLSGGRHDLRSVLLIGGVGMGNQLDGLRRGARLIIGTPGRINDHLEHRTLNLSRTGFLVLDEADRMLDMGFAPQLDRIRRWLTGPRQTQLFSATLPADIQKMASHYLREPVRITVGSEAKPVERIQQKVLKTSQGRKIDDLVEELRTRKGSILIFVRTQHRVDRLARTLKEKGFDAVRIHGGRTQGQRRSALDTFKTGGARMMVATDIAARGLDILAIAHVINYDLPQVAEDYVHRVGRTARAGAEGDSLTLLTPEDSELWRDVLKHLGEFKAAITEIPSHFQDHAPASSTAGRDQRGSRHSQNRHTGQLHAGPHHWQGETRGRSQGPGGGTPRPGDSGRSGSGPREHENKDPNRHGYSSQGSYRPASGNRDPNRPGSAPSGRDRQDPRHRQAPVDSRRETGRDARGGRRDGVPGSSTHKSGNSAAAKVKRWIKRMF